ncbi:MAG: lamin tail domain-containing protein [Ignavibacteriales bacterium]|nr:MAG: T9SS type A sorting domain-containing protein [Ignavibacteriaceae bacterium]MBW7872997.1 lamin tail domain-containing protein [Ignavibacteria bacterium]MCZ2142374.1 lamin tail domain-containing protein [Ignavibacteriales bacterium]OQY72161.1 MAG: hypothetical protein B6D45_09345 [Ignavibacteriales bacterium UTCHB3]MBV6445257.1 hypothetical protein [Ignavibacteriaceae bacterium]
MLKRLLFLTLFLPLILFFDGYAQTYLINEGFESVTFPPTGWTNSPSGTIRTINNPRTGAACLGFNGANDAIYTPLLANPEALSFWYRRSGNLTGWTLKVQVSTDASTWTDIGSISNATTSYQQFTYDLSSLSNIYIRLLDQRSTGTAERYVDDFTVTERQAGDPSPALTADNTNNDVDHDIEITFTDDAAWRAAITAVKIGGTALTITTDYTIAPGKITLKPSGGNNLLTTSGTKSVAVTATGYLDATVSQVINSGAPTTNSTATISAPLAINSLRTVTVTAKDQYNNLVSGYSFHYDVTITDNDATTDESYTIDGTGRTSTTTNLTVSTATNGSGVATFAIVIPAVVDKDDGISVQVKLSDGSTSIAAPFEYFNTTGITITGSDPGSGNFIRSWTQQILYRYKIDVVNSATTLDDVTVTLAGSYTAEDLGVGSLKLYYSTDNTLDGSDLKIGTMTSTANGSGETKVFENLNKALAVGTHYLFLTADVKYDATPGHTINGKSSADNEITFTGNYYNTPGTYNAPNTHSIIAIPPLEVPATDLFISEYVEGSSNNKYIEIFNGTGADVDLSNYKLQLFANGANSATKDVTLSGTLASNAVKVYKNSGAALTLPDGVTAENNDACNFNGDDALALYKISTSSYVDIFGRIGSDPVAAWTGDGGYTTVDKTLRRKPTVKSGITSNPVSGFPTLTTEWDMYNTDDASHLGTPPFEYTPNNYTQSVATGNPAISFIGTGASIVFTNVTTGATVTLTRYEGAPVDQTGLPGGKNVSDWRWVIEGNGLVFTSAELRFKASSLTGITDPENKSIDLYKRATPGSGAFALVGTLTYEAATDEYVYSGVESFSEFVMVSEAEPLPVELSSFTAKALAGKVMLNWETKTEVDNNGFEVQRSTGGDEWQKIGFVEGHGTANSPKYYNFVDDKAFGNKIQYRLKQIDNDGSFEYSPTVEVELNPTVYALEQNYPNPFNPSTKIRFSIPVSGTVTLSVYNAIGQKVATLINGETEAGYHEVNFDAAALPSGLYFYEINTADFKSIKKMLLLK